MQIKRKIKEKIFKIFSKEMKNLLEVIETLREENKKIMGGG